MSDRLSEHFTLAELTVTSTGLPNRPDAGQVERLRQLCARVLEPIRELIGCPMIVTSGFRSAAVNRAVGGNVYSQHMDGDAADWKPQGRDARAVFLAIARARARGELGEIDQAILYASGFIHVSTSARPRHQLLTSDSEGGSGGPYHPYRLPA